MKKSARHCTLKEIKKRCAPLNIKVDTTKHDRDFSDYVTLSGSFAGTDATLIYSVFNGRFFGKTVDGVPFNETAPLDARVSADAPWFTAILELVFVEEAGGMAKRPTLDEEVTHWLRRTIGEALGRTGEAAIAAATPRMLVGRLLPAPSLADLETAITSRWAVALVISAGNTVADVAAAIVAGMQRSAA